MAVSVAAAVAQMLKRSKLSIFVFLVSRRCSGSNMNLRDGFPVGEAGIHWSEVKL
jgi:hypothetical protein